MPSVSSRHAPCAARDEERLAADRAERADRRVHAAGDARPARASNQSLTRRPLTAVSRAARRASRAKYVRIDVGAGALDREQVLQRDGVAVDPAELRGRLHHRVLAAHVVRRDRNVERGAHRRDDVEVRERGLHHHHVGALVDVERDLGERLAAVRRVHLVAAAVAELRRALGRVAERAVERRRVLRRVGEDRGRSWPAASSAARIAATWPSIIPDGAITSAPASACATAMLA